MAGKGGGMGVGFGDVADVGGQVLGGIKQVVDTSKTIFDMMEAYKNGKISRRLAKAQIANLNVDTAAKEDVLDQKKQLRNFILRGY